jgi:hypothetical protein
MHGKAMDRARADRAAMNAGMRSPEEGVALVSTYGDTEVSRPQS